MVIVLYLLAAVLQSSTGASSAAASVKLEAIPHYRCGSIDSFAFRIQNIGSKTITAQFPRIPDSMDVQVNGKYVGTSGRLCVTVDKRILAPTEWASGQSYLIYWVRPEGKERSSWTIKFTYNPVFVEQNFPGALTKGLHAETPTIFLTTDSKGRTTLAR